MYSLLYTPLISIAAKEEHAETDQQPEHHQPPAHSPGGKKHHTGRTCPGDRRNEGNDHRHRKRRLQPFARTGLQAGEIFQNRHQRDLLNKGDEKMKRSDFILSRTFLYGLPAVICLAVYSAIYEKASLQAAGNVTANFLHELTGLVLGTWMLLTVYLAVRLLISETFRDEILARITFMKERDEREALLTGKATKTTFLMTLALLFLLLCLSCFQVSLYHLPPEKAVNGKTGVLTLGTSFKLAQPPVPMKGVQQEYFSYTALPVSTTGIILILILWHIFWYNFSMRREMK